jgi:hypothetical protein
MTKVKSALCHSPLIQSVTFCSSITCDQLWSENITWKILEINNSKALNNFHDIALSLFYFISSYY